MPITLLLAPPSPDCQTFLRPWEGVMILQVKVISTGRKKNNGPKYLVTDNSTVRPSPHYTKELKCRRKV